MRAFPFTIVTLLIYNIVIVFSGPGVWDNVLVTFNLFSGEAWPLTTGILMILAGLLVLLAEILRATTIERSAITNHVISVVVVLIYVVEFVVVAEAGTSTFFVLTMIALVDVLGGIVVTIRLATRDFSIDRNGGGMYPPGS